jgi:hypothetical protein
MTVLLCEYTLWARHSCPPPFDLDSACSKVICTFPNWETLLLVSTLVPKLAENSCRKRPLFQTEPYAISGASPRE